MGVHLAQDARMACCVPAPVRASCPCRIPKLSGEPGCRLSLVLCSDPGPAQEHPRGLCWPTASPAGPVSTEFTCLPLGVALPTPAAGPGVPPGPAHPTQLGTVEPLFEVQPRPTSPTSSGVLWAAPLRAPPIPAGGSRLPWFLRVPVVPASLHVPCHSCSGGKGSERCPQEHLLSYCGRTDSPQCPHPCTPRAATAAPAGHQDISL